MSELTLYQTTKSWPYQNSKRLQMTTFLMISIMMISVFDRVENNVGKEENAGYQHFLLCPQCFQKISYTGLLKVVTVW